jgi:hypothetical protein
MLGVSIETKSSTANGGSGIEKATVIVKLRRLGASIAAKSSLVSGASRRKNQLYSLSCECWEYRLNPNPQPQMEDLGKKRQL